MSAATPRWKVPFLAALLGVFFITNCRSSGPGGTEGGTAPERVFWKPPMESADRRAILPFGPILEALNLRPGMKAADIGAGTGFFSFPIAAALKGTGRVYAIDTDREMIGSIRQKMRETGTKNITAVRVSGDGTDPFYDTHKFDVIFVAEMYHHLRRPVEYFRGLRPSLVNGTGRLYIIHFRNDPDFSEIEFDGFARTMRTLKALGESSPVFKKAAAGVESFTGKWNGEDVPPPVREKITANFNRLLRDRGLLDDMLDSYPAKTENDLQGGWIGPLLRKLPSGDSRQLARWLITELDARDAFRKETKEPGGEDLRYLRGLNRLLLTGIFRMDKLNFMRGDLPLFADKNRIISDMKAAGYTLVRERDFLVYHEFLEFRKT
jgi:SAM-dependent methyltransferase